MSGTTLKIIALFTMLLDHIYYFIPDTSIVFHYIGRLSAPLFMFCIAEGFAHTSNKIKYLKRLYIASVIMGVINMVISCLVSGAQTPMSYNIMGTWFLTGMLITIYDKIKNKEKDGRQLLVFFIISQVVSIAVCFVLEAVSRAFAAEQGSVLTITAIVRDKSINLIEGCMPNVLFCEGGYLIILFGFMMYYYRKSRKAMPIIYMYMCVAYAFIILFTNKMDFLSLFTADNCQWMMLFATPFYYLYNGKRGVGLKYLFYVFYPLHLLILFVIANYIL